jgi:flagellar motor switch protein FliM
MLEARRRTILTGGVALSARRLRIVADNAVLSQREIDALFSGQDNEQGQDSAGGAAPKPTAASPFGVRPGQRIKPYDFKHPEKLSKEQFRSLQLIQQSVANSTAAMFSASLRSPAESRLSAMERGIYEEFLTQIGTSAVVVTIGMQPLQGAIVAAFGVDVAYGFIDRLLGGEGRMSVAKKRDLSDIEMSLIRNHIGSDIAGGLIEPWSRIVEIEPEVIEVGVGLEVLHAIPPNEFVITSWFEVRFSEQVGSISVCVPLTVLEQIMPGLSDHALIDARKISSDGADKVRGDQLLPMNVPLQAILGGARVSMTDLMNLSVDDVIVLDQLTDRSLRARVAGRDLFHGTPGISGNKLAFQVDGVVDGDGWEAAFDEWLE